MSERSVPLHKYISPLLTSFVRLYQETFRRTQTYIRPCNPPFITKSYTLTVRYPFSKTLHRPHLLRQVVWGRAFASSHIIHIIIYAPLGGWAGKPLSSSMLITTRTMCPWGGSKNLRPDHLSRLSPHPGLRLGPKVEETRDALKFVVLGHRPASSKA